MCGHWTQQAVSFCKYDKQLKMAVGCKGINMFCWPGQQNWQLEVHKSNVQVINTYLFSTFQTWGSTVHSSWRTHLSVDCFVSPFLVLLCVIQSCNCRKTGHNNNCMAGKSRLLPRKIYCSWVFRNLNHSMKLFESFTPQQLVFSFLLRVSLCCAFVCCSGFSGNSSDFSTVSRGIRVVAVLKLQLWYWYWNLYSYLFVADIFSNQRTVLTQCTFILEILVGLEEVDRVMIVRRNHHNAIWGEGKGPIHTGRAGAMQTNGTCCCEWECSHCTQATSKDLRVISCACIRCGLGLKNLQLSFSSFEPKCGSRAR